MLSLAAYAKPPRPSFLALASKVCEYAGAARRLALMRAGCASARGVPWLVLRVSAATSRLLWRNQLKAGSSKAHKLVPARAEDC